MSEQIPLQAVPAQTLNVSVDNQPVAIALYTLGFGDQARLYMDLQFNGGYVIRTKICRNCTLMLSDALYYGFFGDFMFVDTSAQDSIDDGVDPFFAGLGTRFQLLYISALEIFVTDPYSA